MAGSAWSVDLEDFKALCSLLSLFGLWSQETLSTTAGKVPSHLDGSKKQRLERKPGFCLQISQAPPETHFLQVEATSQNLHILPKLITGQEHGVLARKPVRACQSDLYWDPLASADGDWSPRQVGNMCGRKNPFISSRKHSKSPCKHGPSLYNCLKESFKAPKI